MGMGGGAGGADSMYNTQQTGMHGQSAMGASQSAYQTQGAGAYQSGTSQYSMYPPRDGKARVRDIIERGKRWVQNDANRKAKEEANARKNNARVGNANSRKIDEEAKLEQEAIDAYRERQQKLQRIGSFKFDIDNELPEAILTSDQVFEDLDDIKNIREKTGGDENNQAYKSLIMAMYTKGKKKKKR